MAPNAVRNKTKFLLSAAVSAAGAVMLFKSGIDYLPREFKDYVYKELKSSILHSRFVKSLFLEITLVIEDYDHLNPNQLFTAAKIYLQPIITPAQRLKVSMPAKDSRLSISLENGEEIVDVFNGVSFKWTLQTRANATNSQSQRFSSSSNHSAEWFELSFHRKHKGMVLNTYFNHVIQKSQEIYERQMKKIKLYTLNTDMVGWYSNGNLWKFINLDHPSTFDKLAMESDMKDMILEDLDRFLNRKEYYKKVGKAWKRGYLLYGPPGTGKSSLIAAMANHLRFDIYDLQLSGVPNNACFRRLILSTENKSILVVEDIDRSFQMCSSQLQNRNVNPNPNSNPSEVTLSGMLNFMDGLWSSCGHERIIIFTTNNKDKLDPALLRPGRMDMQIHMSYCSPGGFKTLAHNYLGIDIEKHPLFSEIEGLIKSTQATPAELAEELMKSDQPEIALKGVIDFLQHKKNQPVTA